MLLIYFFEIYFNILFLDANECKDSNYEFNTCNLTISNCVNLVGRSVCECRTGYYANNTGNGCIGEILYVLSLYKYSDLLTRIFFV